MEPSSTAQENVPTGGAHLLDRRLEVIDLTREIYEGMPIWENHQKPFIMNNHRREDAPRLFGTAPFEAHNLLISEHAGTHTDAVFEYDPNGPTLDKSPLEYYYGEAICLDLRAVQYPSYITPEDLQAALDKSGQEIRKGDTVLLFTGYGDATYPDLAYTEKHPGLNRDAALWLAEKGVVNIGVDNVAIDHADDTDFSGHVVCGEYGIVNTEGLANLDKVVNQRFLYFGLPLFIRNGTGSPIRAIAVFQD
jgi:kynurenine formamidase